MSALPALLDSLIDYAGLFPPAKLPMVEAVRNYANYRRGPYAFAVGRFIVPAARLDEFASEFAKLSSAEPSNWQLSAIGGGDLGADVNAIQTFHARALGARVASVEVKATTPTEIARLAASFAPGVEVWIEVPTAGDVMPLIAAIREARLGAKIRTGGITADAFPPASDVARFMHACQKTGVVFKATAGLHHPLRGDFPLTYETNSARNTMFGFLNIFLAAALVHHGGTEAEAIELLGDSAANNFSQSAGTLAWRGRRFTATQLASTRKSFCRSFGSCSFTEPIDGLRQLSWL